MTGGAAHASSATRMGPCGDAIAHHCFETNVAALMFGIDEDLEGDVQDLSEVLAGRPKEARRDLLQAVRLILRAGAGSK